MSKKILQDMMNGKKRSKSAIKEAALNEPVEAFAYWIV
jgi:hypothetical protein